MYRNLFFDVDDTLLDFEAGELKSLRATFEKHQIDYTDKLEKTYLRINAELWRQYEKGSITREQIFYQRMRQVFKQLGIAGDPEAVEKEYFTLVNRQAVLIPRVEATLEALRDYHLYIVSNGFESAQRYRLTKSHLIDYFDDIFVSDTIGAPKPSQAFFDYVAKRTPHFKPQTSLIIGDSLTSDIQGGRNAHLDTAWFNPQFKANHGPIYSTYTFNDFSDLLHIVNPIS